MSDGFPPIAEIMIVPESAVMGEFNRQMVSGMTLSIASVALFFWWGFHFDVFGGELEIDMETTGFLFWAFASLFWFGFAIGGVRTGVAWAGGGVLAFAWAGLLGVALGEFS